MAEKPSPSAPGNKLKQVLPVNKIHQVEHEDDAQAKRTVSVDKDGNFYSKTNPIPVELTDGNISIGTVNAELEVQLSRRDNYPDAGDVHDSTRIGDQNYELKLNPDGSINVLSTEGIPTLQILEDRVENITYRGMAAPGALTSDAAWKIVRTVETYNNKTSTPDFVSVIAGTGEFDQIWDNRVSLFAAETPIPFWKRDYDKLLGFLTNANWMQNTSFDSIIPDFTDPDTAIISYYRTNALIGRVFVKYNNALDWQIDLERYLTQDDSGILILDNNSPLLLDA